MVATTVVAGLDTFAGRWVTDAEAAACPSFAGAPRLDGALVFDESSLDGASHDGGNIVERRPCAVLLAGSVSDVKKMVGYCREHGVRVAARGLGNSTFGQSLAGGGLVIDTRQLNAIHSIGPDHAHVDAGVQWNDLISAAYERGLTPPSILGYTQLTVGGTLSIGGLGVWSTYRSGALVDRTRALEVVTGTGELVRCSDTKNSSLFNAVLAGQGQCGVITRATVDLVPAKRLARTYRITYPDLAAFFRDTRVLIGRGEFDSVGSVPAPGTASPFQLWATVFYDAGEPPNTSHLLRGLSPIALAAPFTDQSYLDYIFLVDLLYNSFRTALDWDAKVKPWFNVIVPDHSVEEFVGSVIATLTPEDIGTTGFVLLFPQLLSSFARPLMRVPSAAGGPWGWVFGILTDSATRSPGPEYISRMLDRNARLHRQARGVGATRYVEDAVAFTRADWEAHYGPVWSQFGAWKRQYDPDGILTPGPLIFTA